MTAGRGRWACSPRASREPGPAVPSRGVLLDEVAGDMYSSTVQVQRDPGMANRTTYTQARATLASLCDRVAETREP